jgi:hypothetical protein
LHEYRLEVKQPGMSDIREAWPPKKSVVGCAECQRLLNAFAEAVRELVALHEKHLMAVVNGDLEPHRFDLMIHMANEKKQNAKYAYIHHQDMHGCISQNETDTDVTREDN